MTLTFNILLKQVYHFALKFCFSVITLSLVNGFTSYSHTMLLRSSSLHQHVVSWPWPLEDLDFQHCSLTICFSVITFSLVYRFTSYSHTMLLWSRLLHWFAALWPSNGRETCVGKLGEIYKNPGSAFPSCLYYEVHILSCHIVNVPIRILTVYQKLIFKHWIDCQLLNYTYW